MVDGDADDDVVVAKSAVVGRAALSAAIQPDIDAMVALIALESFEPKHKFPDALKLPLHDLAIKALKTGDFGENLFQAMAAIFPYNLFTMRKFIVKDVYPHRKADIEARKDAAISKFEVQVNEAMPASEAAYVQSTEKYARDREAWDAAQGVVGDENAPPVVPMPPPTSNADVSMDVDGPDTSMADVSTATPAAGKERASHDAGFRADSCSGRAQEALQVADRAARTLLSDHHARHGAARARDGEAVRRRPLLSRLTPTARSKRSRTSVRASSRRARRSTLG